MKYIKHYEHNNKPQIGDYVTCKEDIIEDADADEIQLNKYIKTIEFTSNNIGKYVTNTDSDNFLVIQFENVPIELKEFFSANEHFENCRNMYIREIVDFSPDKEYLRVKRDSNKFNL